MWLIKVRMYGYVQLSGSDEPGENGPWRKLSRAQNPFYEPQFHPMLIVAFPSAGLTISDDDDDGDDDDGDDDDATTRLTPRHKKPKW
jgi:hypothetical protein